MICGAKWKTCNCPWFNYEQVENDRLNHFNIPVPRPEPDVPGHERRGYHEELDFRRRQEEQDELIARRLQALNVDLNEDGHFGGHAGIFGVANPDYPFVQVRRDPVVDAEDTGGDAYDRARAHIDRTIAMEELEMLGHGEAGASRRRPFRPGPEIDAEVAAVRETLRQQTVAPRYHHHHHHHQHHPSVHIPAAERVVPRRTYTDYATEYAVHLPEARLQRATSRTKRAGSDMRRLSTLAGLTRNHGQGGRVGAWLQHVEDHAMTEGFRNEAAPLIG